MKTTLAAFAAVLALPWSSSSAAPRLVVSTPSLAPESQIDFVLDRPVVAPDGLGKTVDNTWFEIKPAIPGKLVWKAQNIASLVPDQPPAIGTTYTFSIPKGKTHLDSTEVPPGQFASLASDPFKIQSSNTPNRYASDYSASTAEWVLFFNDEVDPSKAGSFITFTSTTGQQVAAKLTRPDRARAGSASNYYKPWAARFNPAPPGPDQPAPEIPVPNALVAAPLSPLPPGQNWRISILKGLPNAAGKASLTGDISYDIGTIEPFAVKSIEAHAHADHPRQIVITFNSPVSETLPTDFLTRAIQLEPRPENLKAEVDGREIHLSGDFSGSEPWRLTVVPPFLSASGLPLSSSSSKELTFPKVEPELLLLSDNQAQLASGSRSYAIQTVNLKSIHVRIKKLTAPELIRAYQGYRHYTGVGHNFEDVKPTSPLPYSLVSGTTVYEKEITLDNPIDTSKEITLLWDEVLPKDLRTGGLFLDVTGTPHTELGTEGKRGAQAIIQLTDLGLAWKLNNKEAFVYAFSCATGQPLKDVTIDVIGEDSKALQSLKTDENGIATLPRPEDARHIRAVSGDDMFVTAFDNTLNTVGLWHFPVRYSWNKTAESKRRAFLFTDRSLYRPGETVRLKGIVRTQTGNAIEPPVASASRIVILDPTEKEIFTTPITISPEGSFDLTYTLPAEKTGTHVIRLEYPEELAKLEEAGVEEDWYERETIRSNASFQIELPVEEFRRNAFEIEQTMAKAPNGATTVSTDLLARYYQGQPVAAGSVKHFTRIAAKNPYPERFRDFLFGNHRSEDWSYWYHYFGYRNSDGEEGGDFSRPSMSQGEATLSPEGKATVSIEIPKGEFPAGREVEVSAEITDANNQTLTSSASTTVHPADVYIGISRNDRLVRVGESVPFRVVAIDTEGAPYPNAVNVTATFTREVNTTVRSRNDAGEAVTRNDATEDSIQVSQFAIDPANSAKEGQVLAFSPKENGRHFLTIRGTDPDGREFATVSSFYVYGAKDYPWLYEDGLRVKLVAEKKSYKAGDTARILVLSPIEGTAIVTVEREKVLRSFLTTIKADNPVIEIPVTADDAPNAYISVLIVKGAAESAREYKAPQLRLGYCELTVENERDKLAVALTAAGPENDTFTISTAGQPGKPLPACRPGDEVVLTGTVTGADGKPAANTELTLYAEDEGTLAVMGYETPDPLGYFYDPRMLDVEAGVSFNNFISEDPEYRGFYNKGFFIGGGADLGNLADLYRKNFDPCATWAPAVKTDAEGKFTHKFKVPDTLTRYRIIAVAHQDTVRFGHAESALVVNKPLMLEPKAPRFANQGDTFSPQVLVQNASPDSGTWEVSFTTGKEGSTPVCKSLGETTQTVTLDGGASATLVFPVKAEDTGTATLAWKATPVSVKGHELTPSLKRRLSDAVETSFEVNYPMPLIRQVKFVKIDKPLNLADQIDPALRSGTGNVELEFSRSPLAEVGGSVDYLLSYPHGCVEQTTSSLMPWFAVESLRSIVPSFAKIPEAKTKSAIQHGANRLLSMQLPDGSFTYWPGNTERVNWASAYAGLGLMLAKQNGANVPDESIELLTKHLIESLRGSTDLKSPYELEIHARALWILALAGQPQPAYQNVLLDRVADLSPNTRAFLALALHQSGDPATARNLLNSKVAFKLKDDGWMRWDADESFKLLAWSTIAPEAKETTAALDRLLHDRNPYGHWRTTWVNGWSLLAMATYAKNEKALPNEWTGQFDPPLANGTVTLTPENPTATVSVKLSPDLNLSLNPKGTAYVRMRVAAKPKIEPIQPVATNGLSVDRIYERIKSDGSAEILTEPKVGDLIRVSLRVSLPTDDTRYLVIEDALPSVFETVNTDFKSQRSATGAATSENDWNISHSELRTDRAVFYLDHIWRRGTYTVSYLARCTVAGEVVAPPAKVEGMYDPEFYALSASRVFSTK